GTMAGMERHRGHFFNWYDTQTLRPLVPLYISSVDSGNLAGHLLTLQPGLLALIDAPILHPRWLDGIDDTFGVLVDLVEAVPKPHRDDALPAPLTPLRQILESVSRSPPTTLAQAHQCIASLATAAAAAAPALEAHTTGAANEWAWALDRQCRALLDDLLLLLPSLATPDAVGGGGSHDLSLTLRQLASGEAGQNADRDADQAVDWAADQAADWDAGGSARERIALLEHLARQAGALADVDYDFLYDPSRHLLTIGYNLGERRQDASYYDLLASEARLGSFVAIAQGQLPQESWFAFGRLLTVAAGESTLLSWSGSMFEYLMPLLVMPTYDNTLLDETYRTAVARQIEYGALRSVPWGVSESGYNTVDVHLNYQYRAFGVPSLGLKRWLAEDLVIAPYASALALMVAPEAACQNLQRLAASGVEGRYGFYEAIDYTPSRLPRGQTSALVCSYMAHHQGMSLLSLAYLLLDRPMQRRFMAVPMFQATALLLQERIPKTTSHYLHATGEPTDIRTTSGGQESEIRVFTSPNTPVPEVKLLSNGRYHVMVTNAGGGYSRWKDLAVTRWHEDTTRDPWGTFCYLRDLASGVFWSTAYQPTLKQPDSYEAIFSEGRAEFRRRDQRIECHTEIAVSPEDDIELRRVHLTNRSRTRRVIEVTSYAEVVLAPPAADAAHPAFSNLFVQTELLDPQLAILCTRRPRSRDEASPCMFHLMVVRG
ncbi:MAG: glucoamylase family protein, partial [Lysobacterales bacterium]